MGNLTLFVSLERLKTAEFGFDQNVEQNYIIPNIVKAQKLIIKPLLGDTKYNELITYVDSLKTGGTVNPSNDILIDEYIVPAIAYYIKSEIVFNTAYKLKNNSNDPNPDRFNELVSISKKYLADSDAFLGLLKEYMCDNSIPQDEEVLPRGCDIFLGGIKYKNKKNRNY